MGVQQPAVESNSKTERGFKEQAFAPIKIPLMIVDDDSVVRQELEELLSSRARWVVSVGDGAALFAHVKELSEPSIVLLDLGLPDSDICDILNNLATVPHPVTLVLFSGEHSAILESVARLAKMKDLKVVGTLAKPFFEEELFAFLKEAESVACRPAEAPPREKLWTKPVGRPELEHALSCKEFVPVYQPLFRLGDGQCCQIEALARWKHPTRGALGPGRFLPDIKKTDLLREFSEAIVRRVVEDICSWRSQGQSIDVAINLPPSLLKGEEVSDFLIEEVANHDIDPRSIILELGEDELLPELETVLTSLIRLHVAGFRVSIDDFGAEHATINRLLWLPVSELKIDQSLVAAMEATNNAQIIIQNAIDLARQLDLVVVAEGIETETTLEKLKTLGCDIGQGFLLSHPMPAGDVPALLKQPK